eukprot:9476361-Pyramimonas_sp.AAC.1
MGGGRQGRVGLRWHWPLERQCAHDLGQRGRLASLVRGLGVGLVVREGILLASVSGGSRTEGEEALEQLLGKF